MNKREDDMICVIVSANINPEETYFSHLVPDALREYADAVERQNNDPYFEDDDGKPRCGRSQAEMLRTSNGCEVKVIVGFQSVSGNDHSSSLTPFAKI